MFRLAILPSLFVVLLITGACTPKAQNTEENEVTMTAKESLEPTQHGVVSLNSGSKWVANTETTDGIREMMRLMADYEASSSKDLDKLQEDLRTEFRTIFAKCTMKGEAHDQLHNYLLPLKEQLDDLPKVDLSEVSSYLEEYFTYFQ
jgi:hypothetical protein